MALVTATTIGILLLMVQAGSALLPFAIGAVIAYIVLPFANFLDRFMPRWLAALLAVLTALAIVAAILAVIIPPVIVQVQRLVLIMNQREEVRGWLDQVQRLAQVWPPAFQNAAQALAQGIAERTQAETTRLAQNAPRIMLGGVLGLLQTIGFVLGLLVLPTWLLTLVNEQRRGARAINRALPRAWRTDFWSLAHIVDRPFRSFFTSQLVIAFAVGVGTWVGLLLLERLGLMTVRYVTLLALIAGLMRLIPEIGGLLGSLPVIAAGLARSPQAGVAALLMMIAVQWLVNRLVASRYDDRITDLHPALFVLILVAVSEVSLLWVFLAAPVTGVLLDGYRYLYGRLSSPPRPAGLLPNQQRIIVPGQPAKAPQTPYVPLVYRRRTAAAPSERPTV
jgi:predicted PurR-regulated permease PerM